MNDDEVVEKLGRRLAEVESRLPPKRLGPPLEGGVEANTGPGSSLRSLGSLSAIGLAAALVAVVGFGLVGRPTGNVAAGSEGPSGSVIAAAITPGASPTVSMQPSAPLADLEVVRDPESDADTALVAAMGWSGPCFWRRALDLVPPDGGELDRAIDRGGVAEGFVETEDLGRYWVGPTAESAARGFGSPLLVIGGGDETWIVVDDAGYHLFRFDTPKGRSAWMLGNSVREEPCSSAPSIEVIRDTKFDGDHVLMQAMGWRGPCFVASESLRVEPDVEAIDRAIDEAGIAEGLVEMDGLGRFWVGPTAESAARAYGSPVLVIDRHEIAWIAVGDTGYELIRVDTPQDRTTWSLGDIIRETPCESEEPADPQ